jgi:hypothetical protein
MNEEQAIHIIEQALNKATEKGSFNLVEVTQILQALSVLRPKETKK